MDLDLLLRDQVHVRPDQKLVGLDKAAKLQLMDQVLNNPNEAKRGLLVDFYLSHSGRRINNRIYSKWGQRAGIDTLTAPFAKPIYLDHTASAKNVIGRFVGGTYEDLSLEAAKKFSRVNDFMLLQEGLESRDWEKLATGFDRTNLLLDPKWEGLGRMRTTARIVDEDAVERFLDGRYLTFSGGFDTDAMVCNHCFSNWRAGEFCDHEPGTMVDGKPVVLLCGSYIVKEGSVVAEPANHYSVVVSMARDSAAPDRLAKVSQSDDAVAFATDSTYTKEESVEENETQDTTEVEVSQETETNQEGAQTQDESTQEEAAKPEPTLQEDVAKLVQDAVAPFAQMLEQLKQAMEELKNSTVQAPEEEAQVTEESAQAADSQAGTTTTDEAPATVTLDKYNTLNEDYANALTQIETLRGQLADALAFAAKTFGKTTDEIENSDNLDMMFAWFVAQRDAERPAKTVKPVENPSVASTSVTVAKPGTKKLDNLGDHERKIVDTYKRLLDEKGEQAAESYFSSARRYLPPKFHPKSFLTSGD